VGHVLDASTCGRQTGSFAMKTMKFTYWKGGSFYLGFWNDYPDYQTQGMSKDELVANLKDLLADMESGEVPYIRKVEELAVAERSVAS
jgi:predicted RNase H-like HicB family nuclease